MIRELEKEILKDKIEGIKREIRQYNLEQSDSDREPPPVKHKPAPKRKMWKKPTDHADTGKPWVTLQNGSCTTT